MLDSQEDRPRPKILVIDAKSSPLRSYLSSRAELVAFQVPEESYLFDSIPPEGTVEPERCLDVARAHSGKFDYVLGERTGAFLWHAIFRLAGDETPFLIIPRFNHVFGKNAYALFLSSQFAGSRDVVFAGSEAASRSFSHFGFRGDPLYLPGIDLQVYRPLPRKKDDLRRSLDLPLDRDILLYVGRMEDDKNILELLDVFKAVKENRDVHLVICFHFLRDDYFRQCRGKAAAIKGVSFIYKPSRETLIHYYNAADLFVNCAVSVFETFGRAPVEAMACGTPPVVADYDGFSETITHDTGFLVPTTYSGHRKCPDVERFTEIVIGALEDRDSLRKKSEAGTERAPKYGCGVSVQAMLDRLERLQETPEESVPRPQNISLAGYPDAVRRLWSQVEGIPVQRLIGHFLSTWKLPVKPADADVFDFYRLWFSHY